jgi:hypothetical protein
VKAIDSKPWHLHFQTRRKIRIQANNLIIVYKYKSTYPCTLAISVRLFVQILGTRKLREIHTELRAKIDLIHQATMINQ